MQKEIRLTKEQFIVFNDDDQFQIFSDEDGFPTGKDFNEDVNELFEKFDYICIDSRDNIYGEKNGQKELILEGVTQAYSIALEVTDE